MLFSWRRLHRFIVGQQCLLQRSWRTRSYYHDIYIGINYEADTCLFSLMTNPSPGIIFAVLTWHFPTTIMALAVGGRQVTSRRQRHPPPLSLVVVQRLALVSNASHLLTSKVCRRPQCRFGASTVFAAAFPPLAWSKHPTHGRHAVVSQATRPVWY